MRSILVVFLLVLSSTACFGGALLIAEAGGNSIGLMPLSEPTHSLFNSGLVLGLILFCGIGVPSVWALWANLRHERNSGFWAVLEGVVLLGWLAAECLSSRTFLWLHFIYGALGLYLIFSGIVLSCSGYRLARVRNGLRNPWRYLLPGAGRGGR